MTDYSGVTAEEWKAAFRANPDAWKGVLQEAKPWQQSWGDGSASQDQKNAFWAAAAQQNPAAFNQDYRQLSLGDKQDPNGNYSDNPAYTGPGNGRPAGWMAPDGIGGAGRDGGAWDFSQFGQGTQNVDAGYQSNAAPMESPWQGGGQNQDFYKKQFGQLLNQQNQFQDQQQQAQQIRQDIQSQPPQEYQSDWSWVDGGLPEVQVAHGSADAPYTWNLRRDIQPNQTTNRDLVNQAGAAGVFDKKQMGYWDDFWKGGDVGDKTNWSSFKSPQAGIAAIDEGLNEGWQGRFSDLYNHMFSRSDITTPVGGGPTAAPGYALPISMAQGA